MDDPLGRLGMMSDVELGCSDVPGWDESRAITIRVPVSASGSGTGYIDTLDKSRRRDHAAGVDAKSGKNKNKDKNEDDDDDDEDNDKKKDEQDVNDGTDDYLNRPFILDRSRLDDDAIPEIVVNENADIQTLQESAEIQGKVVLLSRGGCGFLEKVKWAQRRGAVAVIVGDNIPGGTLVTMYAKGETTNVTIPSIFTSYTTAHLLSSLIPSKGTTLGTDSASKTDGRDKQKTDHLIAKKSDESNKPSMFKKFLACLGFNCAGPAKPVKSATPNPNSRPPSSGRHNWVPQQDWDETIEKQKDLEKSKKGDAPAQVDNFVIGVQDWRNPDLVKKPTTTKKGAKPTKDIIGGDVKDTQKSLKTESKNKPRSNIPKTDSKDEKPRQYGTERFIGTNELLHPHEGLWVTLTPTAMSSSPFIDTLLVLVVSPLVTLTVVYAMLLIRSRIRRRRWRAPKSVVERLPVRTYQTISSNSGSGSSTSLSASVTAPLLSPRTPNPESRPHSRQRNRIGRRPRSRTTSEVVDQYSGMSVGPSDTEEQSGLLRTPRSNSPALPAPSPQFLAVPGTVSPIDDDSMDGISLTESEKREKGLAEWRRRYGGRQRECVVCLEEYVDGVSRVMSLPCGHEFHVECITPWLTTRRRTCPICKGDVVRSLARQDSMHGPTSSSVSRSPAFARYRDNPSRSRQTDGQDEEEFGDDGNVEDGPLPPFVDREDERERSGTFPIENTLGSLATGAGALWNWSQSAYGGARDWVEDRYVGMTGQRRSRRGRRRGRDGDRGD
jgi:hypothetical protein